MSEPRGITKRTVLILLVVSLVLFGLGAGVIDMGDTEPSGNASVTTPGTETATDPGQPTVTVTPPGTSTPAGTDRPAAAERPTPTPEPTPTLDTSLSGDAEAPDDVSNEKGLVGPLWGSLDGTLAWNGSVDSVVVVVSSLAPEEGWIERERVTVRPEGDSLSLESLIDGERYRYLGADGAAGFSNPDGGTTATRRGAIGITAVLFEDGEERRRVTETDDYRFEVANTGGVDISLSDDDGDDAESIEAVPTNGGGFAPGKEGNRSMTVNNTGRFAGTVRVYVTDLRGSENGFAGPEAAVDDDQQSELLEQLQLRMSVVDGEDRRYVLGGPAAWIDLDESVDEGSQVTSFGLDPGENRTIVVEWGLPSSAGNEVMTDTANWDLEFVFESDGAE